MTNLGGDVAESRNAPVAPGEVQGSRPAVTAESFRDEFVSPGDSILDLLMRADRVCDYLASTPLKDTVVPSIVRQALERAQALRQPFAEAIRNPDSTHFIPDLETRYGKR